MKASKANSPTRKSGENPKHTPHEPLPGRAALLRRPYPSSLIFGRRSNAALPGSWLKARMRPPRSNIKPEQHLLGMKRILPFILTFLGALCSSALATNKPNIVVILSDDMGFSDIGCYGGEIQTPQPGLRWRRAGLRFTQFYNTARCCPTRASLLTGLHPASGGHRAHDGGPGTRRVSRQLEPPLRDHRRGAQTRRLPELRRRQMARHAGRVSQGARRPAQLAVAARL